MAVNDELMTQILKNSSKICVLGLSADSSKPSQRVPLYMNQHGYEIVGVNPGHRDIAGFKIFDSLAEVPPTHREFINVFRKSDQIPMVIDEILKYPEVKVIWLQLGITHPEAEKKAERAGITVISNRCLHIEHQRLLG